VQLMCWGHNPSHHVDLFYILTCKYCPHATPSQCNGREVADVMPNNVNNFVNTVSNVMYTFQMQGEVVAQEQRRWWHNKGGGSTTKGGGNAMPHDTSCQQRKQEEMKKVSHLNQKIFKGWGCGEFLFSTFVHTKF